MKILPIILLLSLSAGGIPALNPGTYKSITRKKNVRYGGQMLSLNGDHTFTRTYSIVRMCIGREEQWDIGVWYQNIDTLILTDTLIYPLSVNATTYKIFGTRDTAIVRVTKYRIKKNGRLSFINCKAGIVNYNLPGFIYQNNVEDRRSRMSPFN